MKKRNEKKTLSRKNDQRKALMKSLLTSLIEHKEVITTLAKAKVLKSGAEKQISIAVKSSANPVQKLSKIRQLKKKLCQRAVNELMKTAEIVKNRKGGYLRIIKLPTRKSDFAKMAKIQWVDEVKAENKKAKKKDKKSNEKEHKQEKK